MKPQWFTIETIPYESMCVDDLLWLPYAIEGKNISSVMLFSEDGMEILDHWIDVK